jgi:tRNA-dihydrouridine synthase B
MKLDFSSPLVVLAPLAGYTDLPFRSVVKKFGADLTISEMISSNALVYNNQKTFCMLQKAPNENPYFIQIAGNNPNIIKQAVNIINQYDWCDGIDLNSGCPAPKVFNHGSGSSLLGDLHRLIDILKTIKQTSNKFYTTIKIRIGIDKKNPIEIAKACIEGGADIISVHGRTKKGAYKEAVDYDAIATIVEIAHQAGVKVIANGDIKDRQKAQWVLDYTKSDGIMIGRGAIGKPWIFYEIKNNKTISQSIKKQIILEHLSQMVNVYNEYGVIMFRKHLHTYSKGMANSHEFRDIVNKTITFKQMYDLIDGYF